MLIGLLSLVVVNLFLAAITHTYADLRKAKKQGAGFVSDVELAQMQRLLELKQTDFLELERKAAADKRLRAPRTERLGGGGRKRGNPPSCLRTPLAKSRTSSHNTYILVTRLMALFGRKQ